MTGSILSVGAPAPGGSACAGGPATATRTEALVARAREVLQIEAEAIAALPERLGDDFARACELILACRGRVVVSGIGKSGHVGRKIAATLASTGSPAFFMHPAEASHGDLGMVIADDVVLALSNSGSTEELLAIVPLVKRRGARLIAMTGDPASRLAQLADVHLDAGVAREACPLNLAPTASTTAAMALGDALAVALLEARGFGPDDFASSHPGGALGRRLLTHVSDVMRQGEALPVVAPGAPLATAILEITRKRMGMVAVVEPGGALLGIFTDGDLRRLIEHGGDLRALRAVQVMHEGPRVVRASALAVAAADVMEQHRITSVLVVDDDGVLVGALNTNDLMRAKVI